jgi:hypothetical protein
MKLIRVCLLLIIASTFTFCSEDESSENEMSQQDDQNDNNGDGDSDSSNQEATILDANVVSDGIIISGATKISSELPIANGAIAFELQDTGSALLNEGFEIPFTVANTVDIAGAYVQISSTDGTTANAYYDIPSTSFGRQSIPVISNARKNRSRMMDFEQSIDIGFNASVPAGQFCYTICLYDATGNITLPQNVCLTIENFGGNSDLIGVWNMTNITDTDADGTGSGGIGDDICFTDTVQCNNGDTLVLPYCDNYSLLRFTLNADGTYLLEEEATYTDYDYDASISSCSLVNLPESTYTYVSAGNWAYNQTAQRLVTVEYTYTETENGEVFTGSNPVGQGEIFFDTPITISGNSFTLSETYSDGESFSISFEK